MEKIRQAAISCTGRAVMFGWLAIFCIMFSLSFNPVSALRAGAVMTLMMAGILVFKAFAVMSQEPKRTEVWIYLDNTTRPFSDEARLAFARTLREVYGVYAQVCLYFACGFFALAVILVLLGFEADIPALVARTPT